MVDFVSNAINSAKQAVQDVAGSANQAAGATGDAVRAGTRGTGDVARHVTSGIGDAARQVTSGVGDTARHTTSQIGDTARSFEADCVDVGGGLENLLGGMFEGATEVLTGQETLGGGVGTALDSVGLPDWAGDMAGAGVDFATKNYSGAVEHGASGLGDVADAAGAEGVGSFLNTASDVTGMFNDVTGGMGPGAVVGGAGGVVFGQIGDAGGFVGAAGGMAGQASAATDVVGSLTGGGESRGGGGLGGGIAGLLGGGLDLVGGLVAEPLDGLLGGTLGEVGGLANNVFDSLFGGGGGGEEPVSETPVGDILAEANASPLDCGGLAGPAAGVAAECVDYAYGQSQWGSPGEIIAESDPGQQLVDGLCDIARREGMTVESMDFSMEAAFEQCAITAGGMLDVADANLDVAMELSMTLRQLDSIASSTPVHDMRGTQMRC